MRVAAVVIAVLALAAGVDAKRVRGDKSRSARKPSGKTPEGTDYYTVADGFSWAENMWFDGQGNLWVSEALRGEIYRVWWNQTASQYQQELFISGLDQFGALGLTSSVRGDEMFAAVVINGTNDIVSFHPTMGPAYTRVAALPPKGAYGINGLALDFTSNTLFTTSLGQLQPNQGALYSATFNGRSSIVAADLTSSDGCFVDQQGGLLYVSLLESATVQVYDLRKNNTLVRSFTAPGMVHLDDFTLDPLREYIFGADLYAGAVVKFKADGSGEGQVLASGLLNATSVRFGFGPGFARTSVFVSEGGNSDPTVTNRRIIEVPLV